MKKIFTITIAVVALSMSLIGCNRAGEPDAPKKPVFPMKIFAATEDFKTRLSVIGNPEHMWDDGEIHRWDVDDQIRVYYVQDGVLRYVIHYTIIDTEGTFEYSGIDHYALDWDSGRSFDIYAHTYQTSLSFDPLLLKLRVNTNYIQTIDASRSNAHYNYLAAYLPNFDASNNPTLTLNFRPILAVVRVAFKLRPGVVLPNDDAYNVYGINVGYSDGGTNPRFPAKLYYDFETQETYPDPLGVLFSQINFRKESATANVNSGGPGDSFLLFIPPVSGIDESVNFNVTIDFKSDKFPARLSEFTKNFSISDAPFLSDGFKPGFSYYFKITMPDNHISNP